MESLRAEAEATRRLLSARASKCRLLANHQTEQGHEVSAAGSNGDENSAGALAITAPTGAVSSSHGGDDGPDTPAMERTEVEGAFDPNPEIKSRFADKSSSLRFVTPEEEKRKRREDMAAVFAGRGEAAVSEAAAEHGGSGGAGGSSGSRPEGRRAAEVQRTAADLVDVGHARGLTKALGPLLEKKLTPSFFARAPPPGSAAAVAAAGVSAAADAGCGTSAKVWVARPSARQLQQKQHKKKAATIPAPRYKPKSKLFRSILSSPGAVDVMGRSACPPPPPPPLPPMGSGLLEQIRENGGGRGMVPPPPPMPMPLLHVPVLPLPQRSLFATSTGPRTTVATVQGPPDGMFAELKAKTSAGQALRLAAKA